MKTMQLSSLIRVLAVATAVSGAAFVSAQTEPAGTTDAGGGMPHRTNEAVQPTNPGIPPGSPKTIPETPGALPENPGERGWRQTQEEFDALPDAQPSREKRKSDGAMKKMSKERAEYEGWTPEKEELPDRDAMREAEKERKGRKLTAQDAGKSVGDREIARQTRRAVVEDKTLSTAAHNVKIISRGGTVTLKGRVDSEAERSSIVEKAAAVVGAENVVNKLTVKTPKAK